MYSDFEEFNIYAYWALVNGVLDVLLWCLGPYVDDSREYGRLRHVLAAVTRRIILIWLLLRDCRRHPVPSEPDRTA
jgi:hypothetical protein